MLGLKRGTVKLANSHNEWKQLFEKEKQLLIETFGDRIIAIEHIGSTAIIGVPAKPLIDINVAISSLEDEYVETLVLPLEKIDYHYMHKFPERRFFAKGSEKNRTHHLNLVEPDSNQWCSPIIFRDYMKQNKNAREGYAKLKVKLASQYSKDRASYTKAKEEFIQKILESSNA